MTDVIVRPEGPLARGSDRRASITFQPGGSAANQAAWLARSASGVDFVARVGSADVESETARFKAIGVTPHLVGDPDAGDRAADRAHRPGRRTQLLDRSRRQRGARSRRHPRCAHRRRGDHPPLRLFVLRALPRAAVLDVMRRAGDKPISVDPASAEFLREVGADNFSPGREARRSCFPMPRKPRFSPARTIPRPSARGWRRSIRWSSSSAARPARGGEGARRWRIKASRRRSRSTSAACATPESRLFSLKARGALVSRRRRSRWSTPTGAGDAFVAGFLAARLTGADIRVALGRAAAEGAAASTIVGGQPRPPIAARD